MAAHLQPLPKCSNCGRAASDVLRNTFNAIIGHYCKRCGPKALRDFQRKYENNIWSTKEF